MVFLVGLLRDFSHKLEILDQVFLAVFLVLFVSPALVVFLLQLVLVVGKVLGKFDSQIGAVICKALVSLLLQVFNLHVDVRQFSMQVIDLLCVGQARLVGSEFPVKTFSFEVADVILAQVLPNSFELDFVVSGFPDLLERLLAAFVNIMPDFFNCLAVLLLPKYVLLLLAAHRVCQLFCALSLCLVQPVV